jgi:hypothetical protein
MLKIMALRYLSLIYLIIMNYWIISRLIRPHSILSRLPLPSPIGRLVPFLLLSVCFPQLRS